MNFFKRLLINADKIREDVENAIANLLEKLSRSKALDKAEESLVKIAVSTGLSSATSGSVTLTSEQLESIAQAIVDGLNKLDLVIAGQLKK